MTAERKPWVVAIHEWTCGPGPHSGRRVRSAHVFPSRHAFDVYVQWATANGKLGRFVMIVDGDPRDAGGGETDWDMAAENVTMHADPA